MVAYCQGYSTKFGTPITYDLGVLDDLYKVDLYEVGRRLGVPAEILAAAPSTGYFPGQTHEGELGATLEEQDVFVYLLFERGLSPEQVADRYGASLAFARVMQHRWDVSLHKRKLIAGQGRLRVAREPLPV
jgi:NAD+ synthase